MKKIFALTLSLALFAPFTVQAEPFVLKYQKNNRWVAKEDAKPLRDFIKTAKSKNQRIFTAILPEEKREVSIERLVVIRDILEQQMKKGVIIEETAGETPENTLVMDFK